MAAGGASSASRLFPPEILPVPPPRDYTPWDKDLSYGNRGDRFGGADYGMALKNVGSRDRGALAQRRKEILDWLSTDEGQATLHESNKRGVAGGLYDRIAGEGQSWSFGQNPGANPGNRDYYGGVDYLHNLALGYSDKDIASFAEQNKDRFRLQNAADQQFGLYQNIQDTAKRTEGWSGIFGGVGKAVGDAGMQINDRLVNIDDANKKAFAEFEQNQKAYERDQAAWRERQTAATQQMQIQQMKAMKQKPVMQIMPTGGSGGGMSAGSLAKKKKQVTGLNIK